MSSEYIQYLHDTFARFGVISARRMFGGYGVYHEGLMFGLVADEVLYLKADGELAPRFDELGLPRFTYEANGRVSRMSYYQAPPEVFEDAEAAAQWARLAYAAALRARKRP